MLLRIILPLTAILYITCDGLKIYSKNTFHNQRKIKPKIIKTSGKTTNGYEEEEIGLDIKPVRKRTRFLTKEKKESSESVKAKTFFHNGAIGVILFDPNNPEYKSLFFDSKDDKRKTSPKPPIREDDETFKKRLRSESSFNPRTSKPPIPFITKRMPITSSWYDSKRRKKSKDKLLLKDLDSSKNKTKTNKVRARFTTQPTIEKAEIRGITHESITTELPTTTTTTIKTTSTTTIPTTTSANVSHHGIARIRPLINVVHINTTMVPRATILPTTEALLTTTQTNRILNKIVNSSLTKERAIPRVHITIAPVTSTESHPYKSSSEMPLSTATVATPTSASRPRILYAMNETSITSTTSTISPLDYSQYSAYFGSNKTTALRSTTKNPKAKHKHSKTLSSTARDTKQKHSRKLKTDAPTSVQPMDVELKPTQSTSLVPAASSEIPTERELRLKPTHKSHSKSSKASKSSLKSTTHSPDVEIKVTETPALEGNLTTPALSADREIRLSSNKNKKVLDEERQKPGWLHNKTKTTTGKPRRKTTKLHTSTTTEALSFEEEELIGGELHTKRPKVKSVKRINKRPRTLNDVLPDQESPLKYLSRKNVFPDLTLNMKKGNQFITEGPNLIGKYQEKYKHFLKKMNQATLAPRPSRVT